MLLTPRYLIPKLIKLSTEMILIFSDSFTKIHNKINFVLENTISFNAIVRWKFCEFQLFGTIANLTGIGRFFELCISSIFNFRVIYFYILIHSIESAFSCLVILGIFSFYTMFSCSYCLPKTKWIPKHNNILHSFVRYSLDCAIEYRFCKANATHFHWMKTKT